MRTMSLNSFAARAAPVGWSWIGSRSTSCVAGALSWRRAFVIATILPPATKPTWKWSAWMPRMWPASCRRPMPPRWPAW